MIELLLMGLRLAEGIPLARLARIGGRPVDQLLDGRALERLVANRLLVIAQGRLIATARGRQRLNGVLSALTRLPEPA